MRATRRLLERTTTPVERIVAVSVTSQWSGTVAVDSNGDPLHDAIIWMDSRGAAQVRALVGGRVKVAGYDPRKLRTFIRLTGGAPAHSGKDSIAHILWLQAERPDIARATWKYLEPKDWLNLKLTGRAAATFDSIVVHWLTDNRDLSRIAYAPELLALAGIERAQLPDLIGATDVLAPLRAAAAEELGLPAGIPVVGGTPDLQSAAVGSGAVADFEGHVYLGTSSWLTCHVPFKKTDILRGVASLPSPLPGKYYVADEQETAGACLNYLRDRVFYPDDELGSGPAPPDVYRRFDELAATAPAGSHRRHLHAVAQRRAHPRRRPHRARRVDEPVALDDPRRSRPFDARGRRVQLPLVARRGREVHRSPVRVVERDRRGSGLRSLVSDPRRRARSADPSGRAPDTRERARRRVDRRARAEADLDRRHQPPRARDAHLRSAALRTAPCTTSSTASSARPTSRTRRCTGA